MGKVPPVVACPCAAEGLDSPCFSDIGARMESCLCVEEALMREADEAGGYPAPLPS